MNAHTPNFNVSGTADPGEPASSRVASRRVAEEGKVITFDPRTARDRRVVQRVRRDARLPGEQGRTRGRRRVLRPLRRRLEVRAVVTGHDIARRVLDAIPKAARAPPSAEPVVYEPAFA